MSIVVLRGRLACADHQEASIVARLLPRHLELTRAESGCISFEVTATTNPLVWQVDERFVDAAAFEAHQKRVQSSDWGQATAGIRRDYVIEEGASRIGPSAAS